MMALKCVVLAAVEAQELGSAGAGGCVDEVMVEACQRSAGCLSQQGADGARWWGMDLARDQYTRRQKGGPEKV